jgi:hypothetical protein
VAVSTVPRQAAEIWIDGVIMAVFEYRVYQVVPGRLPALHRRFGEITLPLFQKHGIAVVGFWDTVVGTSNQLHYLLRFDDLAHRERAWAGFTTDPDWTKARAESERDGPLVVEVHNQLWRPTPYSPLQ